VAWRSPSQSNRTSRDWPVRSQWRDAISSSRDCGGVAADTALLLAAQPELVTPALQVVQRVVTLQVQDSTGLKATMARAVLSGCRGGAAPH
jgi:hypothetical protein